MTKNIDNKTEIAIGLQAYESKIYDYPKIMAKITDAGHKYDRVIISTDTEGVAIEELTCIDTKFLKILEELCLQNNWPKEKFKFLIGNMIQDKTVWPSIQYAGYKQSNTDDFFFGGQKLDVNIEKNFKFHFGMLVNGSTWPRLWLASFINENFPEKIFQTFRRNLDNPVHMVNLDLDRLFFYFSNNKKLSTKNIDTIFKFIKLLPIEKHTEIKNYNSLSTEGLNNPYYGTPWWYFHPECLSWYNNFAIDIICESDFIGKSFAPSEKTIRAILTKTPFITHASADFLKNLKKLGFKTFSKFWDETYDDFNGTLRLDAMEKLIKNLSKYSIEEINALYKEMIPLLEHNYNLYKNITREDLIKVFNLS